MKSQNAKTRLCGCLLCTYSASSSRLRYTSSSFRAVSSDGKGLVNTQTNTNTHTHRDIKSEWGYKILYYCTGHSVPSRKRKLRLQSARLSPLSPSRQQHNGRMFSKEDPISHKQHCQNTSTHCCRQIKNMAPSHSQVCQESWEENSLLVRWMARCLKSS